MRNELEKRIRKQRAELDGIERDMIVLENRKRVCSAIIAELDALLRLVPKGEDGHEAVERHLRAGSDPFFAREVLRKNRSGMHIKDILEIIGGDTGRNRRSSLASQLGTYVRKGEVFTKEGPNIFGLIDYGPEPVTLDEEHRLEATIEDDREPRSDGDLWDNDDTIPF